MDDSKSIEQLENDYWNDTEFPTALVESCYRYRKIPLKDMTSQQIRTLVGQNIGLKFLLPKAFQILTKNILIETQFYPGDLLQVVLSVNEWSDDRLKDSVKKLVAQRRRFIEKKNETNIHRQLLKEIDAFLAQ